MKKDDIGPIIVGLIIGGIASTADTSSISHFLWNFGIIAAVIIIVNFAFIKIRNRHRTVITDDDNENDVVAWLVLVASTIIGFMVMSFAATAVA